MNGTRRPLWRLPAGPFFALAAIFAALLPWLWFVPFPDARMVHLRLGFFGFAASAVTGYVLTALPAWGPQRPRIGTGGLVALFILARGLSLAFPDAPLPVLALTGTIGLAILVPALRMKLRLRLPIAAAPLALALAEAAMTAGLLPPETAAWLMAGLILLVGGKAIPAFIATEAARQGRHPPRPGPLGLLLILGALMPLLSGRAALIPGGAFAAAILWRLRPAIGAGTANLLLALAWGSLGLTVPLLALAEGEPHEGASHLFLILTMGGTVFAFAGRVTMTRPASGGLRPRRPHLLGMALIAVSAVLRALAGHDPGGPWLLPAALGWSGAWLCFLVLHLPALRHPAPFPVLSATRHAPEPADDR